MSEIASPTGTLVEIGPVEAKYCMTDDPLMERKGMLDEVVRKAQKESGGRFIKDFLVTQEGTCVKLSGTAMRLQQEETKSE